MCINVKNIVLIYLLTMLMIPNLYGFQGKAPSDKKTFKVVIDPGHGGRHPGTSGKYTKEKDIVLKVALKVGTYLKENVEGIEVVYTRTKDVYVDLNERAIMANNLEADLFVSIHANAMPPGNGHIYGTETFVMGLKNTGRNFEVAKRENSVILLEENYEEKYKGFDPKAPVSNIMFSIMQEAYQENSILLAQNIEDQFSKRAGRRSLGVKQSSLWVLWNTSMPSVLVELGYLTNSKEEKELNNAQIQDYLASAIYRGIKEYKEFLDSTK